MVRGKEGGSDGGREEERGKGGREREGREMEGREEEGREGNSCGDESLSFFMQLKIIFKASFGL